MIPTQRRKPRGSRFQVAMGVFLVLLLPGSLGPVPKAKAQSGQSPRQFDVADTWYLRSRTTGYSFRTAPPEGQPEQDHFQFYQHFDGAYTGMASGKLDLRFSMRFADDWAMKANPTTPARLHVLYLQVHTPWRGRARLGRLFLQEGAANYTMDGLYLSLKPTRRLRLRVWGGSHSPGDMRWESYSLNREGTVGAHALGMVTPWLDLGISWVYLERNGYTRYQKIGGEARLSPLHGFNALLRGHYETETEQWDRAELRTWYQPTRQWPVLSFQYLDRRQSVDKNTYWERFLPDLDRVRLARAGVRYENDAHWGLELAYFGSFVDEFSQTRVDGALIFPYGRLGYSARVGDAGEESRWYGDLRWRPLPWCDLSGGAMLSTYALMKDAPQDQERDLVTLYLRALTRLKQGFDVHLELQSLENPMYSTDVRMLIGIDLALGRGASRTGLGTGGWLQ